MSISGSNELIFAMIESRGAKKRGVFVVLVFYYYNDCKSN